MTSFEAQLNHYLTKRITSGTYRRLPAKRYNKLCDFTSNDYLALSQEPALVEAACRYAHTYGTGSKASRLLAYNTTLHAELEDTIAYDKGTETALVFVSGYQANASALATLLSHVQSPLVFSDRLNHASIHHACQLAQVQQIRYAHLDMAHLDMRLIRQQHQLGTRFIVTESVFGMDGDCVNITQIAALANQHDAVLYIDEAHATGVMGCNGFGLATDLPSMQHAPIILGTFSKALGGSGGYIACSKLVKRYLLNACGGQIYSTALSPIMAGVALAAWHMVPSLGTKREQAHNNARLLTTTLAAAGIDARYQGSPIIPVMIRDAQKTVRLRNQLAQQGYAVAAIRSPTVALGHERIRISCTAGHTKADIQGLARAIIDLLPKNEYGKV